MGEELLQDIEELRHLQNIANRPRVLTFISSEISNLEKLLKDAVPASASHIPAPTSIPTPAPTSIPTPAKVTSTMAVNYTALPSFSWDQDSDKVKIYVSLEGIDQEKIEAVFNETSCDVKFHDVQGKNYRCAIPKLNGKIAPEKCKVLVKPTPAIITLLKASKGNWMDLQFKEDKLKPNLDKEKDPMAGIMGLMKNLYEDGDEEMKQTIAKAWTDARSGKAADPLKGYR